MWVLRVIRGACLLSLLCATSAPMVAAHAALLPPPPQESASPPRARRGASGASLGAAALFQRCVNAPWRGGGNSLAAGRKTQAL